MLRKPPVGGAYLSYEGVEKAYHMLIHSSKPQPAAEIITDKKELLKIEKEKIRSAIRTDFILSVEIIVIALGTVINESLK